MLRGVILLLCLVGTRTAFFAGKIQALKEFSWLTTMPDKASTSLPYSGSKDMPEEIHLMLHTLQESLDLTMTLSPVNTVNMPVYRIHNNGGVYTSTYSQPANEHCGLYRNKKYSGAFVCKEDENGQFDIMGTMRFHGQKYRLWPADTNTTNKAHVHVLSKVEEPTGPAVDYLIRNTSTERSERSAPNTPMTQTYTVELLMYTDSQDYFNFQLLFGLTTFDQTAGAMSLWYSTVAEFITLAYGVIVEDEPCLNITVKTVALIVAETPDESAWATNNIRPDGSLDAGNTLSDFADFSAFLSMFGFVPSGDHSMAFTGRDLWAPGVGSGIIGIAYIDALCSSSSSSINENRFIGYEGNVAAHELGHSIGAFHDGQEGCNDMDLFIMAAIVGTPAQIPDSLLENVYRFSPCSIAKFNTSLQLASCTHQDSNRTTTHRGPAGQLFDADAQCRLLLGSNSRFCRRETSQLENCFDRMCTALLCVNPVVPSQCLPIYPKPRTSCGSGKWCEAGLCVADTEAPITVEGCPQGDDPTAACDAAQCPNYSPDVRSILCCNTCNEAYICPVPTTPTPNRKSKCSWRHRR